MFQFPLSLLLIPYGLAVIFVFIMAAVTVYHLITYAATTKISFHATFAFFAGIVFLFFFTYQALDDVNWNHPVVVGSSIGGSSSIENFSL